MMLRQFSIAARLALATLLITGVVYPLVVSGFARVLFPRQSGGSLVHRGGSVVGSSLIGQSFSRPEYFHGRPSAAGDGYDATASGGSNLGPTSRTLAESVAERVGRVRADNGLAADADVPIDLVTASGSGLDPHITPAAALLQVPRVAESRNLPVATVRGIVQRHIEGRQLGVLGERRVNVLELNIALDAAGG